MSKKYCDYDYGKKDCCCPETTCWRKCGYVAYPVYCRIEYKCGDPCYYEEDCYEYKKYCERWK